jgi:hypothetical protein
MHFSFSANCRNFATNRRSNLEFQKKCRMFRFFGIKRTLLLLHYKPCIGVPKSELGKIRQNPRNSPGQMKKTLLGALMKVLNVAYFDTNLKSKSIRIVYTQSLFQ